MACCRRWLWSRLLAGGGWAVGAALAQVEELPPMTVSGAPAPPELSALDAAALDSAGTPVLTELLRLVPGVHVDRAGAAGGVSSLYLRGAEPNFTAVFLDGVRLNDPTNTRGGSLDFSTLTTEELERVEVLRGPVSALYGADALAGAINLVSARGTAPSQLRASVATGDQGYERGHAAARGAAGSLDYAAGFAHLDAGDATPDSEARLAALAGNVGWTPRTGVELRATLRHGDAQLAAFPEDSGGSRHAQRRELERRDVAQSLGSIAARWLTTAGFGGEVRFGSYRRNEQVVSPGVAPGVRDPFGIPASTSDSELRRDEATALLQGRLGPALLLGGVHRSQEHGRSDAVLELLGPARFELSRDNVAAFGAAELAAGPVQVEGSVRIDRPEGRGDVTTPRARFAYALGPVTLSVAGGRGYKLPSFYALGHPLVGNPELRPEKSRGIEAGVAHAHESLEARLSVFRTTYQDAVDFEEGPPPRLVNRDRVLARGAEAAIGWRLGRGHVGGQVTYVDARIEQSDERLRNRPRWTGGLEAGFTPWQPLDLRARLVHVGRNLDSSIPTGDRELPGWLRLDLGAGGRLAPGLALHLDVENALDEDYDELLGFPGARRNARLRLEMVL